MGLNLEVFRSINNLADKNLYLDSIMIFCSKYLPYFFVLAIILLYLFGISRRDIECRKVAVSTIVFTIINLFVSFIIGSVYYVNRPFADHNVNLLVQHSKNASFPSDHVIGTFSIALGLGKYSKVLRNILTILSILVGISRIYVGNHYPLDVIGGFVVVIIMNYVYKRLFKNTVESIYVNIDKAIFKN
ncbi:undecaprenyl-diphosphatase [Clostridium sardiniense]|uniref:Undecaprenyl-diphosphatase n=1 Tax=Clostridium sardiniense TaxID=29369 RepID=A0ABS7L102_CLOSR|nr:undecaprenyl-diphosphatase [Clostridium sardiniense]MBM7833833.1 undecaprenyl-diphosphatase [Clostridium sardiniense]MBY0756735.1 undecaprenyl-diphosphatase [Clostridium sardiniense]MDQ0460419.1 undecaprenyl-diphosphatase [Clostridium sardiniense]